MWKPASLIERSVVRAVRAHVAAAPPRVVSFDVFDTVLWRLATPEAVVSREVDAIAAALGLPREPVASSRHRFAATQRAAYAAGQEAEWHVGQWLGQLAVELGLDAADTLARGLAAHLEIEQAATRPVAGVAELLTELKGAGIRTAALSDTWSPAEELRALLEHHGLVFDDVVASGTEGVSKRRGTTFSRLCERWFVDPAEWLHVGDNWKADLVRPRAAGLRVAVVPRAAPLRVARETPDDVQDRATEVARALQLEPQTHFETSGATSSGAASSDTARALERVGRELLAPLLAAFTLVARRRFAQDGVERVLFFARDAHLMHAAWAALVGDDGPPAAYVRLSRRAIALAHPDDLLRSGAGLAGRFSHRTVAGYLASFGLDDGLRCRLLRDAGLAADQALDDAAMDALRRAFAGAGDELDAECARVASRVADYVGEVTRGARRIGVVDSGWAGTTQDVLAHVLDVDRVTGVYLGVSDLGRPSSARSAKVGVLRDDARTRPWMNALDRTAGVIRLWDTVLREPHASVSGLERDEGVVRPVLDSDTEPTEEQRLLTDALVRGTVEGLRSLRPGFAWLDANPSLDVDAVGAFACACSRALAVSPERDVARALLALRYEEADGSTWSLGWDAIRDRRAWYPGLLSGAGLRPAARLLERAGRVATRRRRR